MDTVYFENVLTIRTYHELRDSVKTTQEGIRKREKAQKGFVYFCVKDKK
ncbi:hypothetical protein H702_08700 [Streptococcus equinus JB1]|uniref:Uncharacterized protein n=1 Tax=Streptococcus equinus JB1 TaxID=1294274 RepID=A0A091BR30_STREI|nr:hypothetical protein H702_08700 [Streptococcus equinus JB1]